MQKKITIGLGTNVGDKLANLRYALKAISEFIANPVSSAVYESSALLPENAPDSWDNPFYNMAIAGEVSFPAEELLDKLQAIERQMGRSRELGKWSPRIIDLDILTFGDELLKTERLTVPHPEMCKRDFVIFPLAELIPNWRHPIERETIRELTSKWHQGTDTITPLQELQL